MDKARELEIYINPLVRRPRALRSMLPVLLSSRTRGFSTATAIHDFKRDRSALRTR